MTFVACNRLQACTFLGEATHDVAAGAVIAAEAGCALRHDRRPASSRPPRWSPRRPSPRPTFVAPPRRLEALMAAARTAPADGRGDVVTIDTRRIIARPARVGRPSSAWSGWASRSRGLRPFFYARRLGRAIEPLGGRRRSPRARGCSTRSGSRIGRGHFGVLQYWRSFDDLDAWSHRPPHSEWWREAVERMRTKGDFGVYHETFLVPRDRIESIYLNCRPPAWRPSGRSASRSGRRRPAAAGSARGRVGSGLDPDEGVTAMGHWGVKSYENDDAADALDAGFERVHGDAYDDLMDDRNPLTFDQVQQKLAEPRDARRGRRGACRGGRRRGPFDEWDEVERLAFAGVVVRHAEFGVPIPDDWLDSGDRLARTRGRSTGTRRPSGTSAARRKSRS